MDVLGSLRLQLDAFCRAEAWLQSRYAQGEATALPLSGLYREHPLFASAESLAAAREALVSERTPESARPYLRRWEAFLAHHVPLAAAAEGIEARSALEAQELLSLPVGTATYRDAESQLDHEPSRERRARTEAALSDFRLERTGPAARALAAQLEQARRIRPPLTVVPEAPPAGATAAVSIAPVPTPVEGTATSVHACEELLRSTQDAYTDVLAFALKRVEPTLRGLPSGDASRHDVRFAAQTPWMRTHFAPADLRPAVTRCVQEWGFHPTAGGRLQLDASARPGKARGFRVHAVESPGDVRLSTTVLHGGQAELAALLEGTGQALRLALLPARGSVEARRLADPVTTLAHGRVVRALLAVEGWHRRYLGAPRALAREAARMGALFLLADLRAACARRLYAEEVGERGPVPALSTAYAHHLERALGVRAPRGDYLVEAELPASMERDVEGWARAGERLGVHEVRFNEDFYRNPASGAWLAGQWEGEGRALATRAELVPPLTPTALVELGARWVQVLGA